MTRVSLTDGSGRWFNADSALIFKEDTYWNGSNHISKATGSQWEHEALYRTKGGVWVLNCWSDWQGSYETYEAISQDQAIDWLIAHRCFEDSTFKELPQDFQAAVKTAMEAKEI